VSERAVAGIDGCKAGWVAVYRLPGAAIAVRVFARFADLVDCLPDDAAIAVDMPIGLPERTGHGGRGPEALVRRFLGARQSSVFSIPSRAAVYAVEEEFTSIERWYEAHRLASAVARATSEPPRAISIQAFGIFSRIRELDALLRARPGLLGRIVESHPETAFWRLAGGRAMATPKKVKGRINADGMEERKALLAACGLPRAFLDRPPPRGAGADDFLDAAAMMLVAERFARGEAVSFPDPPGRDAHGLPIAIWT
jgi:predicted RNase H-like nuclease